MVGTVAQAGTRVFVAGTSSGIDTAALIDAAVAQKTARATRLQDEVDANVEKISAYAQLKTLLDNVVTSLDSLRGPQGLFDTTERVFDKRSGTITAFDGSNYASFFDIAIDSDADIGSYDIEIIQKAQVQRVAGASYADPAVALGFNGTFDIGLSGGGATATISITAGQTLNDVATAINAQKDTTGVTASVLKVAEGSYKLVLTGADMNKTISVTNVTGDDVLNLTGVTDGLGGFLDEFQPAQGSIIELDGVTITRDDNNYDDLLTGVDLDIKNAAPGTVFNLDIDNDTASVKDAILNFVDNYNLLRDFVVQNHSISADGVVDEDAVLFGDALLERSAELLSTLIGENFGNGGTVETIRDLGLTIGANNKLVVSDEVALDNAILNNFDDVRAAFASTATSDDSQFALLRNRSSYGSQSIVFDLTTDGAGTITGVTANGDNAAFTINGSTITGVAGTQYEGLTFSYQGTAGSVTINADISQGLADRLTNGLDGYVNSTTGLLIGEQVDLESVNEKKLQDAQDIIDKAESYRERQIEKYAEMESKLAALEVLKRQIRAILGTNDDNNN